MEYRIKQYALQQGALEIQYIEEFFGEFPRRKMASEVMARLGDRDHQILMAEAALPDDRLTVVPVAYKVSHELRMNEADPKLADLIQRLAGCVEFRDRKVLYGWIGGTRRDWRGQGFFRALTEEQEALGARQWVRRGGGQDEEQALWHAGHVGSFAVQRDQVRTEPSG